MLDWYCPFAIQLPRLVAVLSRKVHAVRDAVLQRWRQMHYKVRHSTVPAIMVTRRRQKRKPSCLEAGICLHGFRGRLVWRFYMWVDSVLKTFCRRQRERTMLQDLGPKSFGSDATYTVAMWKIVHQRYQIGNRPPEKNPDPAWPGRQRVLEQMGDPRTNGGPGGPPCSEVPYFFPGSPSVPGKAGPGEGGVDSGVIPHCLWV